MFLQSSYVSQYQLILKQVQGCFSDFFIARIHDSINGWTLEKSIVSIRPVR